MKHLVMVLVVLLFTHHSFAQQDSVHSVAEQIKQERDYQLNEIRENLKKNEEEIRKLTDKLANSEKSKNLDKDKIADLEKLQLALDKRTRTLEEAPKTKVNFNGQLAFTELLSIQRDLQPAQLFSSSQDFFNQLGNIGNLQKYTSFLSWKSEYDKWYQSQDKNDQMLQLLHGSIGLIGDISNKIPLYGSIVQTVSSGVGAVVAGLGKKHKELLNRTPSMLKLLNATSQFEHQKAIIDHEWEQINVELNQLQVENDLLLKDQLSYYGISYNEYSKRYMDATLDTDRDKFKNDCRATINSALTMLDNDPESRGKWLGQVETYMYKVQSLRLRFGNLTNRMLSNLQRYDKLIELFSDDVKFPSELTNTIRGVGKTLSSVRKNFSTTFKPEKYIEDSAVMYIERN